MRLRPQQPDWKANKMVNTPLRYKWQLFSLFIDFLKAIKDSRERKEGIAIEFILLFYFFSTILFTFELLR